MAFADSGSVALALTTCLQGRREAGAGRNNGTQQAQPTPQALGNLVPAGAVSDKEAAGWPIPLAWPRHGNADSWSDEPRAKVPPKNTRHRPRSGGGGHRLKALGCTEGLGEDGRGSGRESGEEMARAGCRRHDSAIFQKLNEHEGGGQGTGTLP